MKRVFKIILLAVGITYLSFLGFFQIDLNSSSKANAAEKSNLKPAPDFTLKDINGKDVKLSDFKGKVVVVDFWATWCAPCRMELPHLIELQKKFEKQGFTFIGISVDEEGVKVVKPFSEKNKINYPILISDDKVQKDFGGIFGYPTAFLIDQKGNIVKKYFGYTSKQVFEKDISSLLTNDK